MCYCESSLVKLAKEDKEYLFPISYIGPPTKLSVAELSEILSQVLARWLMKHTTLDQQAWIKDLAKNTADDPHWETVLVPLEVASALKSVSDPKGNEKVTFIITSNINSAGMSQHNCISVNFQFNKQAVDKKEIFKS